MDIKELSKIIEDRFGEFELELFHDGSGTLSEWHFPGPNEELFEFDQLDELYKFLGIDQHETSAE